MSDDAARRRAVSEAGPRPNMQEFTKNKVPLALDSTTTENKDVVQTKEKTECDCSKNGQHFPTTVMDKKYDTTIETMYNLLYNSTFMNKFLSEVEKSTGNLQTTFFNLYHLTVNRGEHWSMG